MARVKENFGNGHKIQEDELECRPTVIADRLNGTSLDYFAIRSNKLLRSYFSDDGWRSFVSTLDMMNGRYMFSIFMLLFSQFICF